MMMLADGTVFAFVKYLQILLWIFIPVMVVAMLITTVNHYKRKRKLKTKNQQDAAVLQFPDKDFFENGSYTAELMHQLSYSNAKCIALRKDFETLEEKYTGLLKNFNNISETPKQDSMEKLQQEEALQEQVNSMKQQYEFEKKELEVQVEELNSLLKTIESDNTSLKEQLTVYSNDSSETATIFQKWENEKNELKYRISGQEYLKDVVEEKKLQIDFLQQQLEHRIKNHHQVEQQFLDMSVKYADLKEKLEGREELDLQLKIAMENKEAEIRSLHEVIVAKSEHTSQLENSIAELEEKNAITEAEMESKEQSIIHLEHQLEKNIGYQKQLEQKLEKNQQVFKGLQRKLADILDEDTDDMNEEVTESPVIKMKPVYQTSNENEEISESAIQ